jgi:methylmalonyl-CoA mutase C-terminal domain/subunit
MEEVKPVRCLLGMLGADVHTKGVRVLAHLLRDRGIEVIYIGEHHSAESMAAAAVAEDADIVGVSFSNAAYLHYTGELLGALRRLGREDMPVMVGGLIHPDDVEALHVLGVSSAFGPGSTLDDIVAHITRAGGQGRMMRTGAQRV